MQQNGFGKVFFKTSGAGPRLIFFICFASTVWFNDTYPLQVFAKAAFINTEPQVKFEQVQNSSHCTAIYSFRALVIYSVDSVYNCDRIIQV